MSGDKTVNLAEKIERLIVDGNKEVVGRVEQKLEETKQELRQELGGKIDKLEANLRQEIRTVHSSLKNEIVATAYALSAGR